MSPSSLLKPMPLWAAILMFAAPSAYMTFSLYVILPMIAVQVSYPMLQWFLLLYFLPLSLISPVSSSKGELSPTNEQTPIPQPDSTHPASNRPRVLDIYLRILLNPAGILPCSSSS